MNLFIEYESLIRVAVFSSLLIILAGTEFLFPLAKRKCSRLQQWLVNLGIAFISRISISLVLPFAAVGTAQYATQHSIGLFNLIELPFSITLILSLLLFDLLIYIQHLMMHHIPLFWRLHKMHHTELGLDVTSAVRFHPIEIIVSMLIKMTCVLLMGIPAVSVIIFEIVLNALALFNHSNIKLNKKLDRVLRKLVVTPEVHWIHHSPIIKETNSNYGFNLVIWDKLFSTYTDRPTVDYPQMPQGLKEYSAEKPLGLYELLVLPFKKINIK